MALKHLPSMLSLGSIKWKRHKSSRFLPEFNVTTNRLRAALIASIVKAKEGRE